ncbi:MAG: glutathione S-transferase family protein [Alphaproteobacteria bacterium]|nr:glutathione S-transferase family protein [Alphaproteobacteria bacterium]
MSAAVYRLYHHPLDPGSRRVRLAMAEKGVACALTLEKPWEPSDELRALNAAADVPVLVIEQDGGEQVLADAQAICEYLDETHTGTLLGKTPVERAETRRLVGWFDRKFDNEVSRLLIGEKALKRLRGQYGTRDGEPDSAVIRAACANIRGHLDYIGWLTERRNWLAGEALTLADLAAGGHLSVIDYLGDVPWDSFPLAKEWYARLKSRPSFRGILGDYIPGFPPPRHYADLDF